MKIYIGMDDTDAVGASRGTGKLARWYGEKLPEDVRLIGVVRQQFPRLADIPFTSNNSSACIIVEAQTASVIDHLIETAVLHIKEHFIDGSDPGLCVVPASSPAVDRLVQFGREASCRVVSQAEAMQAAAGNHLSGHGGTNDGIIGAAAGIGLSIYGWTGRFVEYNQLRSFADIVTVGELEAAGIRVISVDRDALVPGYGDRVNTNGWLRPRLWGDEAVLPVFADGPGMWRSIVEKRRNETKDAQVVR